LCKARGMSERVEMSNVRMAALLLAALIAFTAIAAGIAAWVRGVNAPEAFDVLAVSESDATKIAIDEVKKREGRSVGFVDKPPVERGGTFWFIAVWRTPAPHRTYEDQRCVVVDGETGQVLKYGGAGRRAWRN
jgi:hypothetical protein